VYSRAFQEEKKKRALPKCNYGDADLRYLLAGVFFNRRKVYLPDLISMFQFWCTFWIFRASLKHASLFRPRTPPFFPAQSFVPLSLSLSGPFLPMYFNFLTFRPKKFAFYYAKRCFPQFIRRGYF